MVDFVQCLFHVEKIAIALERGAQQWTNDLQKANRRQRWVCPHLKIMYLRDMHEYCETFISAFNTITSDSETGSAWNSVPTC